MDNTSQDTAQKILFTISWDVEAIFLERLNRFVGLVQLKDGDFSGEKAHIHDPGRLEELLFESNEVLLRKARRAGRKTRWDLIAAKYEDQFVLVNSGIHRRISEKIISNPDISPFGEVKQIKAEVRRGSSRLDFYITTKNNESIWIEVKGCTLAVDGKALFPDAPTARGKKHLDELIQVRKAGERAAIVILIFRQDAECFGPNWTTDPDFSKVFELAVSKGVEVYPLSIGFYKEVLTYSGRLPLCTD